MRALVHSRITRLFKKKQNEVTLQRPGPGMMQGKPGSITRRQTFGSVTTGYWHIRPDPPISSDKISHILRLNCCKFFCFVLLIFLWKMNERCKYPIFYNLNKESRIGINEHWKLKQRQQQQNRQSGKDNWNVAFPWIFNLSNQTVDTINALNTFKSSYLKWTNGEKNYFHKRTMDSTRYLVYRTISAPNIVNSSSRGKIYFCFDVANMLRSRYCSCDSFIASQLCRKFPRKQ